MTQSKACMDQEKIEQLLYLRSVLLQGFCRVNTAYQAGALIVVNHIKISAENLY